MSNAKIIIVGGGIFTWSFLWQLSLVIKSRVSITLYDASKEFPPCSINSTALVARRGNHWGASELGDLIQNSWNWWNYIKTTYQWGEKEGVVDSLLFYQASGDSRRYNYLEQLPKGICPLPNLQNRLAFEPAIQILPETFLSYLKNQTCKMFSQKNVSFVHVNKKVHSFCPKLPSIQDEDGNKDAAKILVLQPGSYAQDLFSSHSELKKNIGKTVYGSFWEASCISTLDPLQERTFTVTNDHYHFYYHGKQAKIQLGIESYEEPTHEVAVRGLKLRYDLATRDGFILPDFEQGIIKIGSRHKLSKRLPRLGEVENCFYHLGGYKIGYLVSLYQAQKLVMHVKERLKS